MYQTTDIFRYNRVKGEPIYTVIKPAPFFVKHRILLALGMVAAYLADLLVTPILVCFLTKIEELR